VATNSSATFSARTQLTSFALHSFVLVGLFLMPSAARHSARPKELDVVFHRPTPRVEIPAAVVASLPQRGAPAPGPRLGRVEPPSLPNGPRAPEPSPAAPGGPIPDPTPAYVAPEPTPQQKIANTGILAFRDKLAGLRQDKVAPSLGSDARFRAAVDVGQGQGRGPSGSVLSTNAPGGSGGIDTGSLGRSVGGGGGRGMGGAGGGDGVSVGRATSPIAGIGGGERPLATGGGLGPARTDEEIQIVFDRYKASFYRLYNKELRNDPSLKGQMVLRLTIEPDGSVSMCTLQSTDMKAPELSAQVVSRVLTINFGAKEGVQALTIVYPIDFLPAA
jgi:hypothetical protein